jgi:hypothetical protein
MAPTLVMLGFSLGILVIQRDLGTASIFLFLYASILFLATGDKRVIIGSAGGLAILGLAGYGLFDVVRVRVDAWINPWLDPTGGSYQIVQSLIAFASGEVAGRGLGIGNPGIVPVVHSDFIFTALGEEFGLIGIVGISLAYILLLNRGLQAAIHASSRYRRYLAAGLTIYITAQALLIMGGNTRLLPLTGVTLPFVSYGGSSLLTSFIALTLLLFISTDSEEKIPQDLDRTRPIRILGQTLLLGFLGISVLGSWWTVIRSDSLQARPDNPRPNISDRFVGRGEFFDHQGRLLVSNRGSSADITRQYLYPPLGPTIGYANSVFGQAGLEASLNDQLRGNATETGFTAWWQHLISGQHPPGLDVRLTLNFPLQQTADTLLGPTRGAIVLIDAESGDILVMASHPFFNGNQLEENWESLLGDPDAPLLNRATQGAYLPGTMLNPFIYLAVLDAARLPPLPDNLNGLVNGEEVRCTISSPDTSWPSAVQGGCPGPLAELIAALGAHDTIEFLETFQLFEPIEIGLPVNISTPIEPSSVTLEDLGYGSLTISPLQAARMAAVLSSGGTLPALQLIDAYETSYQTWQEAPAPASEFTFPENLANQVAGDLGSPEGPFWETVGRAVSDTSGTVWYLGGTLSGQAPRAYSVVVVLERDDPLAAQKIGRELLELVVDSLP